VWCDLGSHPGRGVASDAVIAESLIGRNGRVVDPESQVLLKSRRRYIENTVGWVLRRT
jgi:hypothetical protein